MSKTNYALARPHVGMFITKDAPTDDKVREAGLEKMQADLENGLTMLTKATGQFEEQGKILHQLQKDAEARGTSDDETKAEIKKHADGMAEALQKMQGLEGTIEQLKKEMDAPAYRGGKDLQEKDREHAIALQRRAHLNKGGTEEDFKLDEDNLVNPADYRSAVHKLVKHVGIETKARVIRDFSEGERKAFEAASLDSGFFGTEMLGFTVDEEIECSSMVDLYDQVSVTDTRFKYPHVMSYGDIGKYDDDAKCDAEYGPEGNITWRNGHSYDWRGVFCMQKDTLREANYDLLGFMFRAVDRSHRIARNQALITGDGKIEPLGWLTADLFEKVIAPQANPTHVDLRMFLASHPVERGMVLPVMHQNVFAYFASMVDNNGRFLFGDGLMSFSPDDVRERMRITNCLPDPTNGGTLGSAAAPFATGSFIMAAGNWKEAYKAVNHRPMFMEQWEGGSSAWCVKYQFGLKDGGFVASPKEARIYQAG